MCNQQALKMAKIDKKWESGPFQGPYEQTKTIIMVLAQRRFKRDLGRKRGSSSKILVSANKATHCHLNMCVIFIPKLPQGRMRVLVSRSMMRPASLF